VPNTLKPNVVVHSHVFEHQEDPLAFARACWDSLNEDGLMLMSLPDMDSMEKNLDLNMLMFEHLTFLPRVEVLEIMSHSGFKLVAESNFEHHSLFLAFQKSDFQQPNNYKSRISDQEFATICEKFQGRLDDFVESAQNLIKSGSGPVYLFGAHIFSQYLLAAGLSQELLQGVLDNNKSKQGQRLYGTDLKVLAPEAISGSDRCMIIMPVASYEEEVLLQLSGILAPGSALLGMRTGLTHV